MTTIKWIQTDTPEGEWVTVDGSRPYAVERRFGAYFGSLAVVVDCPEGKSPKAHSLVANADNCLAHPRGIMVVPDTTPSVMDDVVRSSELLALTDTYMNVETAFEYLSKGLGFVSSGGYTYYKGGYLTYGTFPGCLRLGRTFDSLAAWKLFCENTNSKMWRAMSFESLVIESGYMPNGDSATEVYRSIGAPTVVVEHVRAIESEIIRAMIDSELSVENFLTPLTARHYWYNYFNM